MQYKNEQLDIKSLPDGVSVRIKVHPRASCNSVNGIVGGSLKVSLTAPPVEGVANEACIKFFAEILGVQKNKISLLAGSKNRSKIIKIAGMTYEQLLDKLAEYLK